jgi:hypothetical protein
MRFKKLFDERMREAGVEVWDINHLNKRYFISLDRIGYEGTDPGLPVFVPAGSLAVFSHQALHRSGADTTKNMRLVSLAQYSCAPILNRHYLYADYTEPGARADDVAFFARRFPRNWKIDREDAYPVCEPKRISS